MRPPSLAACSRLATAVACRPMDFLVKFYEDATVELEILLDGHSLLRKTLGFGGDAGYSLPLQADFLPRNGSVLQVKIHVNAEDYSDSFEISYLLTDAGRWASRMLDEKLNIAQRLQSVNDALEEIGLEKSYLSDIEKRRPLRNASPLEPDLESDEDDFLLDRKGESLGERLTIGLVNLAIKSLLRASEKVERSKNEAQAKEAPPVENSDESEEEIDTTPRRLSLQEEEERLGLSLPEFLYPLEHYEISCDGESLFYHLGADLSYSRFRKAWEVQGIECVHDWFVTHFPENPEDYLPDEETEPELCEIYENALVIFTVAGDGITLVAWHPTKGWFTRSEDTELTPIVNRFTGEVLTDMDVMLSHFDLIDRLNHDPESYQKVSEAMHGRTITDFELLFDSSAETSRIKMDIHRCKYEKTMQLYLEWQDGKKICYY